MALSLTIGKRGGLWQNDSQKELNLLTTYDRVVLAVFAVSFILALVGMMVCVTHGIQIIESAMLLTAPFFLLGLMWYYHTKKWSTLVFVLAVSVALYFYLHNGFTLESEFYLQPDFILIFTIDFIFIGSIGVVAFVSALQRVLFYRVVSSVQAMNIKDEMSLRERVVAFMFNVPNDIDTRQLTMDYNLKRASIPWAEIRETMTLGLMISTFLWIYISMSPTFSTFDTYSNVPVYIFALVLYIPVIVMPWSIFNALRVRITTRYRDFELYEGIKGTIKRMILPMFAALIYILLAFNKNDAFAVISFIALSFGMIVIIIAFTSAIYYAYFESKLVDDIIAKWKVFRPVELLMKVDDDSVKRKEYPGMPKRDMDDFGEFVFGSQE